MIRHTTVGILSEMKRCLRTENPDIWAPTGNHVTSRRLWSCGDVVVFDLRTLSDEEREMFFEATEGW